MSHHPPISACNAFSDDYEYFMDTNTKMGFNGTYMKATPIGLQHIRLKSTNEHFYFNRPTTYINNIIMGKMFVDHAGEMKIKNHQTGHVAVLDFKAAGWSHKTRHHIDGLIYMNE